MADQQTRHVSVVTVAHQIAHGADHTIALVAGEVTWAGMRGQSQLGKISPRLLYFHGAPACALIEHATADVGDVLSAAEVASGISAAAAKLAAYKVSLAAEQKELAKTAATAAQALAEETKASASVPQRLAAIEERLGIKPPVL